MTHPLPLDPYKPCLLRCWNEGCRNAKQLWREIGASGYGKSRSTVGRFIGQLRRETGWGTSSNLPRQRRSTTSGRSWGSGGNRRRPDRDQICLAQLLAAAPELADTYELAQGFCRLVRERRGDEFDLWLAQVQAHGVEELRAFAQGLLKDEEAVRAGLTLPWSQGQTEGQVTRLKLLKRGSASCIAPLASLKAEGWRAP